MLLAVHLLLWYIMISVPYKGHSEVNFGKLQAQVCCHAHDVITQDINHLLLALCAVHKEGKVSLCGCLQNLCINAATANSDQCHSES